MSFSIEDFKIKVKNVVDMKVSLEQYNDDELRNLIEDIIRSSDEIKNNYITIDERVEIAEYVYNSIRGLDLLDKFLCDDSITEIMINGSDNIFIERSGTLTKVDEKFESEDKLNDIIQRIVSKAGREVNIANPIVDTRLTDGSRVNVVLPPIALDGSVLTIRKFSKYPMTMEKLINYKSITKDISEILKLLVISKYNIFISGGTGSGKTTFLNALSNFIPEDERIITIEDSAELQIKNISNLVRLETRNSNTAGSGSVTIRDLIRTALRMRPERIIVGEVRGSEALEMLQAFNTGHEGSLSTGHSNSALDMLSRLETMVLSGSVGLPLAAVRQQIASSIDIIIHLSRMRDKSRKAVEISEVCGISDGEIQLNPIYIYKENSNSEKCDGALIRTENEFKDYRKLRAMGFDNII